ncbi:MAG: CBS domain-containing protein [Armatimonadetes bacterium]|nr:CBS domain-containing protein [Armatimonadota bacterium]
MQTAGDIMTRDVVVLTPEMSVAETSDVLTRYRIHGAPVVDETGMLIGMVSLVDLVGRVGDTVADVMTSEPVFASTDTPVDELAGLMLDQMVRRVPIVEGGRVVGVVSASDIIQVFLNLHDAGIEREAGDQEAAQIASRRRARRSRRVVKR